MKGKEPGGRRRPMTERTEKEVRRLIQFHNSSGSSEKVQITRISTRDSFFFRESVYICFFIRKEEV